MLTQAELAPDPLEPTSAEVERYVKALQEQGDDLARREVWNQIRLAGARAGRRREEAHDSLNRIFRLGSAPSEALDGPYDGILVTTTTGRRSGPADAWPRPEPATISSCRARASGEAVRPRPAEARAWPASAYTSRARATGLKTPSALRTSQAGTPGAYLGKVLLRRGRDRHWALMGYFALQPAR